MEKSHSLDAEAISRAHHFLADSLAEDSRGKEDPANPSTVQAMQLVLHLPKSNLPARNDVLVSAAQSVVGVCLDPRAGSESAWRRALAHWYGHRIRKVARRARGAGWDNVQSLPGRTFSHNGAQVRAFIPSAVGEVPHLISKLQINGTDLAREDAASPAVSAEQARGDGVMIFVDDSLGMSAGKAAAQVGHASMLLAAAAPTEWVVRWAQAGFPLAVREVPREVFRRCSGAPGAVVVRDSGFTEVAPGSVTAVAVPGVV